MTLYVVKQGIYSFANNPDGTIAVMSHDSGKTHDFPTVEEAKQAIAAYQLVPALGDLAMLDGKSAFSDDN